ncbi:MFS transporter [Limibaculum sp. M0105]|uniref:MFS transporter n=1 Tax=Thermohalobaculum xanthum TaxID=2753746 RepID=A0A8J7SBG0_9RHOB|nr:MFS transporter [Thermohalobaculum xanthum]MBK0397591.1 MFS transporter [Thermohalobaculum xanthum]
MLSQRHRVVLALGSAQTLAWGSTFYLPAILAGPMARDLGVSTGLVFGAFSGALVISALLGPRAGRRIDRFGGRGVLAASNLVFAAGLALLGAAPQPAVMVVGWLVLGIGMSMGLYESAFAALAQAYGRKARGAITGITLLAGLASTICWPVSAWLEAEIGWRGACFVWAAMQLVVGLPLNLLCLPRGATEAAAAAPDATVLAAAVPGTGPGAPAPAPAPAPVARSEPHPRLMLLLGFVFAITWFVSTAMAAHLPQLLQASGVTPVAAIAAAALVGPAQVAGRVLEFGVLQRFSPLLSARLATLGHPLAALGLISLGAPFAAGFALLHGAGNGILTIAKGTLPLAIFGPSGYGHRQGVLTVPARFAQAAAPFVFALLIERIGTGVLAVSAGLGLAALLCLLAIPASAITAGDED